MKIYGDYLSGNCYKIKLLCSLLALEYEWISIDILNGDTRTDSFLSLNPEGQIPLLVCDDGAILTESNAILYYLAVGSRYWPDDKLNQARVLKWQYFEQYSHEPNIAVARFIALYLGLPDSRRAEYESKHKAGYRALDTMERTLLKNNYLVGKQMTIADISLYAYTHVADQGGFDLSQYPAINRWLARVRSSEDYVDMES